MPVDPDSLPGASDPGTSDARRTLSPWPLARRRWVSVLLALHLAAIGVAPMAVVDPASDLAISLHRVISPWTRSLYLDHGYRFFAPEPGPGHFVTYEIRQADGNRVAGRFPDRAENWPRLLYHRWFMLSETMYQHLSLTLDANELQKWQTDVDARIRELIAEGDPRGAEMVELQYRQERNAHDRTRQLLDHLSDNVGQELMRRHDGVSIQMKLVTRLIPPPPDILNGTALDDPRYTPVELQVDLGAENNADLPVEVIDPREAPETVVGPGGRP